jgi:hypothetical protein
MKSYTLRAGQAFEHVPEFPERTVCRNVGMETHYKTFRDSDAMYAFLCKGTNGITWTAWKDSPAGYRYKQLQSAA